MGRALSFSEAKIDGPKIRAPRTFVRLTENVIALSGMGNPNKGLPDLIKVAIDFIADKDPLILQQAIRLTAVQLNMPERDVIKHLTSIK
jgi:hypothetical protein